MTELCSVLIEIEQEHAVDSLMLLVQKRCGLIKPRTCANEITQREAQLCEQCGHKPNYESHEAAITTGVIEANSSVI